MDKMTIFSILIVILVGGFNLYPSSNSYFPNSNAIPNDSVAPLTISNSIGTFTIDKTEYYIPFTNEEFVNIHGNVNQPIDAGKIHISITLPDNTIAGTMFFTTTNNGEFDYQYPLSANSPKGTYLVFVTYNADVIGKLDFTINQGLPKQNPTINNSINLDNYSNAKTPTNNDITVTNKQQLPLESYQTSISTDKIEYHSGEIIQIKGQVNQVTSGMLVKLSVTNPLGNTIVMTQLNVANDKTYSTQMTTQNQELWDLNGTYRLTAQYGTSEPTETSFIIIISPQEPPTLENSTDQYPAVQMFKNIEFPKIPFSSYVSFGIIGIIPGIIIPLFLIKRKKSQKNKPKSPFKFTPEELERENERISKRQKSNKSPVHETSTEPPKVPREFRKESTRPLEKQFESKPKSAPDNQDVFARQREEQEKRDRETQNRPTPPGDKTEFDPYQILGLSRTCSCSEVKARYREMITKKEIALTGILNMSADEIKRRTEIQSNINKARDQIMNEKNCGK